MSRVDKAQAILDKCFPQLKMDACCSRDNHETVYCFMKLASHIALGKYKINEDAIRTRLQDMLIGMKDKIEADIKELK